MLNITKETVTDSALVTTMVITPILAAKELFTIALHNMYDSDASIETIVTDPRAGKVVAGIAAFAISGFALNNSRVEQ